MIFITKEKEEYSGWNCPHSEGRDIAVGGGKED